MLHKIETQNMLGLLCKRVRGSAASNILLVLSCWWCSPPAGRCLFIRMQLCYPFVLPVFGHPFHSSCIQHRYLNVLDVAPWSTLFYRMLLWECKASDSEGCLDLHNPRLARPAFSLTDECPTFCLLDELNRLKFKAVKKPQQVKENSQEAAAWYERSSPPEATKAKAIGPKRSVEAPKQNIENRTAEHEVPGRLAR